VEQDEPKVEEELWDMSVSEKKRVDVWLSRRAGKKWCFSRSAAHCIVGGFCWWGGPWLLLARLLLLAGDEPWRT